jgi:RNA polymerase sigma factor (sigma-70 family)
MDPELLLCLARAGDQKAWNDLLVWCRPLVRAQLKRALPTCPDEASELTNDVQMRMHRGFSAFHGEVLRQFVAWARVIARNVLCDFLIGRPPPLVSIPAEPLCPRPDVSAPLIEAEDLVRLAAALEKLPEHYRKVIEARLFDRLPPHVIAERFGWPQVTVRVYSMRAVELLARQLRG